jgi:hypothetical protein
MSTVSSVSSSADSYATQLAETASLKQSLTQIGSAIQNGDMTSANSLLTAFMQQNPQFDTTSSSSSTSGDSQDPVNQDFQSLVTAVSGNQVSAAQSAWTQVLNDFAKAGVSLSNSAATTAEAVEQGKANMDQQLLSDLFGTNSSSDGSSLASLLASSNAPGDSTGLSSSILGAWVTYEEGGTTTPTSTQGTLGGLLNTSA